MCPENLKNIFLNMKNKKMKYKYYYVLTILYFNIIFFIVCNTISVYELNNLQISKNL